MFKAKICSDESSGMLKDGLDNSCVQGKVRANGLTSLPYLPALCAGSELFFRSPAGAHCGVAFDPRCLCVSGDGNWPFPSGVTFVPRRRSTLLPGILA